MMQNDIQTIRADIAAYIRDFYGVEADFPWPRYPDYAVFRHAHNRKWFALVMRVEKTKLGLSGAGQIDIVNLKLESALAVEFLTQEPGFLPGYHIARGNWVSVLLDGSVPLARITPLIDQSFAATAVLRMRKSE